MDILLFPLKAGSLSYTFQGGNNMANIEALSHTAYDALCGRSGQGLSCFCRPSCMDALNMYSPFHCWSIALDLPLRIFPETQAFG